MQLMDWDAFQDLLMRVITEMRKMLQILTLNYNVVREPVEKKQSLLLGEQSIAPATAFL